MIRVRSTKPMSPGMRFFFSRIFPLIFVTVGVVALYLGWQDLQRAKASATWPTSHGVIQQSSVEYHRNKKKGGGTYHAEVLYDFTVDETIYSGNRVAFGDWGTSDPSHARRIVNRYPKNKAVTVYYDQENPETCVLEPGIKGQTWFLSGFGLIFLAVGILMAVYIPKAMNTAPADKR